MASSSSTCFSSPPFSRVIDPSFASSFPCQCSPIQTNHISSFSLRLQSDRFIAIRNVSSRPKISCMCDISEASVITKDSWENLVLDSQIPVLVEFYASWCGPCRMVDRVIDEIATEYAGRIKCFLLNADNDPQVTEEYDIKAVPVVLLFKNGQKCDSVIGTMPKEFYVAAIERVLNA